MTTTHIKKIKQKKLHKNKFLCSTKLIMRKKEQVKKTFT